MTKKCSVTFRHPKTIVDKELRTALGQEAAKRISKHTQEGLDAQGRPMRPLQSRYARIHHHGDRTRRLTVTGKMLLSARLRYPKGAVMIVWLDPKAAWHQRDVGWIGLTDFEQRRVARRVQNRWKPNFNKNLKTKTRYR